MGTPVIQELMTVEEYAQLDEVVGFRHELIEGERVFSPNAALPHAIVIERTERLIESQLAELSTEKLQIVREAGWSFRNSASGTHSVPVPDLMVIHQEDARRAIQSGGRFEGLPLLTIEVISPSERKARRLQKVGLYLNMDVPHVVEVDYTKRIIRVHTPESESVALYSSGDQMAVPFQASTYDIFSVLD